MADAVQTARDALRAALLSSKVYKPKSVVIELFGQQVEVRQPPISEVMKGQEGNPDEQAARMIIKYCYVPGTDERVFEEGDIPTIMQWPFGDDVIRLQEAINKLSGFNIEEVKAELKSDPLDSASSDSPGS